MISDQIVINTESVNPHDQIIMIYDLTSDWNCPSRMTNYDVNTGVEPNNPVKECQALFVKGRCLAGFNSLKVNEPHFVSQNKCGSLTI